MDRDGAVFAALPRGFYLRAIFTAKLVRERFGIDADEGQGLHAAGAEEMGQREDR